jgi:hypothetical protein
MTQAHGSHRDSDDDEIPPLPERALPPVTDEVPVFEEEEPPGLPADEVVDLVEDQEIYEPRTGEPAPGEPSSGAR